VAAAGVLAIFIVVTTFGAREFPEAPECASIRIAASETRGLAAGVGEAFGSALDTAYEECGRRAAIRARRAR
jgi:hypothetical protein